MHRSNKARTCQYDSNIDVTRARVAQSVQCLTTNWATGFRSLAGAKNFSSSICVQTGSGVHPCPYLMGTGGPFSGGKASLGHDTDHSPPSSAKVKNEKELYLSHLMCLHGMYKTALLL
jgi:hypothetical protein